MAHGTAAIGAWLHLAQDAIALWYGWTPSRMPTTCACGRKFEVEHALSCAKGAFPSIRHNEIRDLTAHLLTEVVHDICTEPDLQPITNEGLTGATANLQEGARLDIVASGVWGGKFEKTVFDVRVFNPHAPSNQQGQLSNTYKCHENEKKESLRSTGTRSGTCHLHFTSLLSNRGPWHTR